MGKKIDIIEVFTKGNVLYGVGLPGGALVDDARVERIVYEQHGYNKGKQGHFAAYVVFFEDSNIRRIIPATEIKEFAATCTEAETGELVPELPE